MNDLSARSSSSISDDILIDGNIESSGQVKIGGTVNGNVSASDLVLEPQGTIRGKISAEKAELRGKQEGKVRCEKLIVTSSAVVRGDIVCQDLTVESGAHLNGKVQVKPK